MTVNVIAIHIIELVTITEYSMHLLRIKFSNIFVSIITDGAICGKIEKFCTTHILRTIIKLKFNFLILLQKKLL